jgi:hypothetical protein
VSDSRIKETLARASGKYTETEWADLVKSDDPLDELTVTNARAIADNILSLEATIGRRISEALGEPHAKP